MARASTLIRKIKGAVGVSLIASKAQDVAAHGGGAAASALLDDLYRTFEAETGLPISEMPIEIDILRSQIAIQVEDGSLALSSAETALTQLESGKGRYRRADRIYLERFCQMLVNYCLLWRDQDSVLRLVETDDMDLEKVSLHLRRDYPLPSEGGWVAIPDHVPGWKYRQS